MRLPPRWRRIADLNAVIRALVMGPASADFSAAETERLDSWMLAIAAEARSHACPDGSGKWRFGSKGALAIYPDGTYHDFSDSGPTGHGHGALALIRHLHAGVDATAWARDFLDRHSGNGDFRPGQDHPDDRESGDDTERSAYVQALWDGAQTDSPILDAYLANTRGLPKLPEDRERLRWIPNARGEEGALIAAPQG
jgi:hypothetical protein